jgi:methyl-accepting chemotaxis protein
MKIIANLAKVKTKLLCIFLIFTAIPVIMGVSASVFFGKINECNRMLQQAETIDLYGKEAQNYVQQFLLEDISNEQFILTGLSSNLDTFNIKIIGIKELLKEEGFTKLSSAPQLEKKFTELSILLESYKTTFHDLSSKVQSRGFKNEGLEGKMREAVHRLQQDSLLDQTSVLMLRRHEKDFIIRKDLSYVTKLNDEAEALKNSITNSSTLHEEGKTSLLTIVNTYTANFKKIVALEQEVGLDNNVGLKGKVSAEMSQIGKALAAIKVLITQDCKNLINFSLLAFGATCVLIIAFGIALGLYIANAISRPIVLLNQAVMAADYNSNIDLYIRQIKTHDEIGQLAISFRDMFYKLNNTINEAHEKSGRLELLVEENNQRSWRNEGLSLITDIIRTKNESLEQLCTTLLQQLIKYVDANQGCIFIETTDKNGTSVLEMKSCYAYGRKKFIKKELLPGEGLAGQCYLEKETILLTDIPNDYISISSGLGGAKPGCVLIVPMLTNETVAGVIELASFKKFEQNQILFIERAAEALATAIISVKTNEQTKQLLIAAEKYSTELAAKEETMRQHLEDLNAIQ